MITTMCDTPVYNNGMNTLGVGNVVPPGMDGNPLGSGDKFGQIFKPAQKRGGFPPMAPMFPPPPPMYQQKSKSKKSGKSTKKRKDDTPRYGTPLPTIVYAKK